MADDKRLVDTIPAGGFDSFFYYSGMYSDQLLTEFLPQVKNRAYQRYMEIQKHILNDNERNWMSNEFFTSVELNEAFGFPKDTLYYELRYFDLPISNKKIFVEKYGLGNIAVPAHDFNSTVGIFSQVFRFMIGDYYCDKYYLCRDKFHRCFIAIKNDKDDGVLKTTVDQLGNAPVFLWKDKPSAVFQMVGTVLQNIVTNSVDDLKAVSVKVSSNITQLPVPTTDNAWDICISDNIHGMGLAKMSQANLSEILNPGTENAQMIMHVASQFILGLNIPTGTPVTVTAIHRPNRRYSYIYTSTDNTLPILPLSEGGHPIPSTNIKMYKYDAETKSRGERLSVLHIKPKYFPAVYDFQDIVHDHDIFIEIIDYPSSITNTQFDNHFSPLIESYSKIEYYCQSLVNGRLSEYPDIVNYSPANISMDYKDYMYGPDSVQEGEQIRLGARILPEGSEAKTISWASSNPLIASVNEYGVVTGLSVGSTIITASIDNGGITDSKIITVTSANGSDGANAYVHNFTSNPDITDEYFTIAGAISKKYPIVYKGSLLTHSLKLDNEGSVTFTAAMGGTLTLVLGAENTTDDVTTRTIKIDGEAVGITSSTGVLSLSLDGGKHTISKGNKTTMLFYLEYVYSPVSLPPKSDTPIVSASTYNHNFTTEGLTSSDPSIYQFAGTLGNTITPCVYNDEECTSGLKLDSSSKVVFTAPSNGMLYVRCRHNKAINGKKIKVNGEIHYLDEEEVLTLTVSNGSVYTITKGDSMSIVYLKFVPDAQSGGATTVEICAPCAGNLREYKLRKLIDLMISDPWLYTEYLKFMDKKNYGHMLEVGTPQYFKLNTGLSGVLTDPHGPVVVDTKFISVCKHDDPVYFTEPHTYIKVKCENPDAYVRVFINGSLIEPTLVESYMNEIYLFISQSECAKWLNPYISAPADYDFEAAQLVIVEVMPNMDRNGNNSISESMVFNNTQEYRKIFEDYEDMKISLSELVFYNASSGQYLPLDKFEFKFSLHSETIEFTDGVPQTLTGSEEEVTFLYTNAGELYMTQDMQPIILEEYQEEFEPEYTPDAQPNTGRVGSINDIMNKKFSLKDIRISLTDPTLLGTDIIIAVDRQVKEFILDSNNEEFVHESSSGSLIFKFGKSFGIRDENRIEVYVNGTYIEKYRYHVYLPTSITDTCNIIQYDSGDGIAEYGPNYKVQIKYLPGMVYESNSDIRKTINSNATGAFSAAVGRKYNPDTIQLNSNYCGRFVAMNAYGHSSRVIIPTTFASRQFLQYGNTVNILETNEVSTPSVDIRDYVRDSSIDGLIPEWPLDKLIDDWINTPVTLPDTPTVVEESDPVTPEA